MHTHLLRYATALALVASLRHGAGGQVPTYPASFTTQRINTNGTTLYVRSAGKGPAVVLLHGFGETGDMWIPLATELAKTRRVIVPDLRGFGLSDHPAAGYTKKAEAVDVAGVLKALNVGDVDVVAHDIGNMVAYAYAAQNREHVRSLTVIDAPLPGVFEWTQEKAGHKVWHFSFWGPDEERLVAGRERIFLDRFFNEFSANPRSVTEPIRVHYAELYAKPGAMHSAFEQFKAFDQDSVDNQAFIAQGKLKMPVLALGGDHSYGPGMATIMHVVANDVSGGVIPNSGHWIMEENPAATSKLVIAFLNRVE
ncbi:MAG TPA: alpha/beta hydrolase [Gemmatimonadaceae bacterium]|jgi:pimeloyl-ACP methyl ester carboxylesterase